MRIMVCLFLFYRILNFCMPFRVLGRLCRNIGIKGMCLYCGTNGKAQKAMERAQARSNILLRKRVFRLLHGLGGDNVHAGSGDVGK